MVPLRIRYLASWIRRYDSIWGCGLCSSAVPGMGVKAKRAGRTFVSVSCWIMWVACFSVSPRPMIRCVVMLFFPNISTAWRNCLSWFFQLYGPFAVLPLVWLNIFCVAASMGMAIRFAPAFFSCCMFLVFCGWHEIEIGIFVCCLMVLVMAVRCWMAVG